jgi:4a-hydroxytetrahydrobiopterin dehydratase
MRQTKWNRVRLRTIAALAIAMSLTLSTYTTAIANPDLTRLTAAEVAQQLQMLPGWETDGQRLYRTYRFANFVEAIAFVNRLVEPAEAAAHHPDIAISYNTVVLSLTTHDAGGLTRQDFALAQRISELE